MKKTEEANLRRIAEREVRDLVTALPPRLREILESAAVVLQMKPDEAQMADGIEPDHLGLFTGFSLRDEEGAAGLPPQIILFLENIFEESRDSGRSFREELRRTFLHELGHYLGLEEDDLALRDVD